MHRHYQPLTVLIIAAAAFGCRSEYERNADLLLSEAMVALDQAKVVMSAVEDAELNAAPLDAWMHLAETYDLMTEIVERYPDTRAAAALETSDSANHADPTTTGSDSMSMREEIHGQALRFLVLAINEDAEFDVWGDVCARASSDTWTLMCVSGWVLEKYPETTCYWCGPPDLSSWVAHGHGRNALRHIQQIESEDVRLTALTSLAVALAWAHAPKLALEAADVLAELEVSWAEAQEELAGDQATVQNRRRPAPGAHVARARVGIVEAQATIGDIEGVLVTLDHLGPGVRSIQTRSELVKALMELDDALERQRIVDRVLSFISSDYRNEFLGEIAVAVAQTGDIQAAGEIMDQITEQDIIKLGVLQAEISIAQAAAGDHTGALHALQPLTDRVTALQPTSTYEQRQKASVLGELAAAYIRAGNRETAFTLASGISTRDSLDFLEPVARALAAEGDLPEALELLITLVESKQRAMERNEPGWFDGYYVALASLVRLAEARIEAGDMEDALTIANRLGPEGYTGGRMFTRIVTEQVRLGDLSGALATALRIATEGMGLISIEALTIIALSFPESDDVRHAIEEHQLSASPFDTIALTLAYAALRDWHRSMAFAVTLEERRRRETLHCILRMFGSASDLNCLPQVDL